MSRDNTVRETIIQCLVNQFHAYQMASVETLSILSLNTLIEFCS